MMDPDPLAEAPIHKHAPRAIVQTTMELPETAPTAKRGLFELRAVTKKIVSGAMQSNEGDLQTNSLPVLSHAITKPPMIDASYF